MDGANLTGAWPTVGVMHAPLLLSLHSGPASAGADARAALPGLALIAVYVGVLVWLHVRRRRARHAADRARSALPARVESRPQIPTPAPSRATADAEVSPVATASSRRCRRLDESTLQPLA